MKLLMHWMRYYRNSDCRKKKFHLGFFLITLPAVCFVSCASFEHLTASGDQFAHAKDCGKCHVAVYDEWSKSDHANAFVNPHFRKATGDYAFENCMGCHAPSPGLIDKAPTARTAGREDGVTCVSCHLKGGKLAGPITPTGVIKPHPIEVDEKFYRSSIICGGCHEGTMQEWNSVKVDKKPCQQCHMQPVKREVTQATGGISNIIVAFEKEQMLRQHDFTVSRNCVPGEIITVTAKREGPSLTIQITNNLPHNLPTGDFGFRVLEIQAIAVDKLNHETVLAKQELMPELSSAILPHSTLTWNIEIPHDSAKASIRLKRRSYQEQDNIVLANVEISF
jgi:hypothetical protein